MHLAEIRKFVRVEKGDPPDSHDRFAPDTPVSDALTMSTPRDERRMQSRPSVSGKATGHTGPWWTLVSVYVQGEGR